MTRIEITPAALCAMRRFARAKGARMMEDHAERDRHGTIAVEVDDDVAEVLTSRMLPGETVSDVIQQLTERTH